MPDTRTAASEPFRQRQASRADIKCLPAPVANRLRRMWALIDLETKAVATMPAIAAFDSGII